MSTHAIYIHQIKDLEIHPNADKLQILRIDGWTCCVQKDLYKPGDLIAFIPPDYVVNTNRPEFAFLKNDESNLVRVKVRKLRGIVSQGIVIPAPPNSSAGDNVIDLLEVKRWEPLEPARTGGEAIRGPSLWCPTYDLENYQAHPCLLIDGEEVIISEKIHGSSYKVVFHDGIQYVGSRNEWKRENDETLWWVAFKQNPWLAEFCQTHPNIVIYGEVFGRVKNYHYNLDKNKYGIAVFDLWQQDHYLNYDEARALSPDLQWVPTLYRGPFDRAKSLELAEGKTVLGKEQHIREGIVLSLPVERSDDKIGRVKLKIVSNAYLMS